nr:hypothetical protein [uncultured bacterium]
MRVPRHFLEAFVSFLNYIYNRDLLNHDLNVKNHKTFQRGGGNYSIHYWRLWQVLSLGFSIVLVNF